MNQTRLLALVAASIVSAAGIAGAQTANARSARAERSAITRPERGLVKGLKLDATEKAKVNEIHAKYNAEGKTLRESMKPAMLDARAARQKGDTAAARGVFDRTKDSREKLRALMVRESSDVRAALTPEHQKAFDTNLQKVKAKRASHEKGKHAKAGKKIRPASNG